MEITKRSLVMNFLLANGKSMKLTVNNPKEGLVGQDIQAAMDEVVASGALGEEALVNGYEGAEYRISQVEPVIF